MTPEEFWRCTPAEIYTVLRSRNRSLEVLQRVIAWHAAVTINHNGWVRQAVSVDDLLGTSNRIDLIESPEALAELAEGENDDV